MEAGWSNKSTAKNTSRNPSTDSDGSRPPTAASFSRVCSSCCVATSACFLSNGTSIQRSHRMIDKGTFMTDFASVQKHLSAITSAQADFAKSSFEANKAYFEKLADVKSADKFLEVTTEYAKSARETFVTEATKI